MDFYTSNIISKKVLANPDPLFLVIFNLFPPEMENREAAVMNAEIHENLTKLISDDK